MIRSVYGTGAENLEDYAGVEEILMIGVLRGCYIFLADLSRFITMPRSIDFIAVSSYGHDTVRGTLRLVMDTRTDITGKHADNRRHSGHGHTLGYLLTCWPPAGLLP
jgi:hypoxanthine-guanine phosphoribosyltransferase